MRILKLVTLVVALSISFYGDDAIVKLNVEPNHSTIGFVVPIAGGITKVRGKFMDFQLYMDYDDTDFVKSKVRFVIQAKSIDTGISDRDDHLRSKDFFDVEKYPEIVFEGTSIEQIGEAYELHGNLTMHGVTKAVEIPFRANKLGKSEIAISFEWKLNRKDFGVGVGFKHTSIKNFIGDNIGVEVDFWTRKAKVKGD
ncbi:YceI family protein [Roseivirga sp. E12]|uniref:YceI family protein n=1 Tax=Roseivirga sp. E12 TaxID=2819237 RepID=UPI001ABD09F1|nr:YceI family protein [Roseivirga sp. E12]MBO3697510.1 YceI family protein [Roseivirga sp. E12]